MPRASSVYVPVITGTYRPPFPASYVGYAADYRREQMQQIDDKIAELEREKYPLYRRELKNDENIRSLRRMLIKRDGSNLRSPSASGCGNSASTRSSCAANIAMRLR